MDKTLPKTENNLAQTIAEWLRLDGWQVYEEVSPWGNNGHRADLVARRKSIVWVIETKNSFNLKLLEQAENWLKYAHFVSIGTWLNPSNAGIVERVCRKFGIGIITVDDTRFASSFAVIERAEGMFNRRANTDRIKKMLVDENLLTGNAGKPGHEFVTPFKITLKMLLKTVKQNPGITIEEALRDKHHYKDDRKAKRNILDLLQRDQIKELDFRFENGQFYLYHADENGEFPAISPKAEPPPVQGNFLF